MNEIIKDILNNGHSFTFNQVMRLLHREIEGTEYSEAASLQLQVRPNLSMGHPSSDLREVSLLESQEDQPQKRKFRITANFLGIYGSGTPLPSFYTEDLFQDENEGIDSTRDFLDLLNGRFYHLLFDIQCKYHIYQRFFERKDEFTREALFALAGFSPRSFRRNIDESHILRYASVYLQHPRCSYGLKSLATDVLESNDIEIEQCVQRTASIPVHQRLHLGVSNTTLGEDAHVGMFIKDRMGKLRVHSGHVDADEFPTLLPGSSRFVRLGKLIQSYIDTPIECELGVRVKPEKVPHPALGSTWCRLGYETFIYAGEQLEGNKHVFFRVSESAPSSSTENQQQLAAVKF